MSKIAHTIRAFRNDESGATAIEYVLIAAGIALAILGAAAFLGDDIANFFNNIGSELNNAQS